MHGIMRVICFLYCLLSIFNELESFSIFIYPHILLLTFAPLGSIYPSPLILYERNAAVAIINVGLTAASESGGQKGNKASEIRGQLPGAKVK